MNGVDFPVARGARRHRRRARGRADAGQDQHGRPARHQRGVGRADGALGPRDRRDAALHRVHGRRPFERLAARRGRPGGGARRDGDRGLAGRAGRARAIAARSPGAGDTPMARASSASSRRSRDRSAATARGRACRPTASSTHACSRSTGRDVRAVLRDGSTDDELLAFLADTWRARDDRYSELRSGSTSDLPKIEMFAMGG